MPEKIYFGEVVVKNSRTGEIQTISNKIYREKASIQNEDLKRYVLKDVNSKDRALFHIVRFCFDTAKQIGETVY